jgi:3-oxoadipate enol-lactonase
LRSSTFLDCSGVLINTMTAGPTEARPILFMNALGTDLRIWNRVARIMESEFHVVRFDTRGHGLSDYPEGPYSIDMLADDTLAVIEDLALDRPIIVGLSLGGFVAQAFAARYPDRLSGLVLMDTGHRIGSRETWQERIDLVNAKGLEAVAAASAERWFSDAWRARHPEAVRGWTNMVKRCPPNGYLACCEILRDTDLTEQARAIKAPTLVVCGEKDPVTPPALGKELAGLIPGARYEELENLAHFPSIERPGLVSRLLTSFAHSIG